MDVSVIAQNSANVFAKRVPVTIKRRNEVTSGHSSIAISAEHPIGVGERIESTQPSVRARFFLEFLARIGSGAIVPNSNPDILAMSMVTIGSLGRVALGKNILPLFPPLMLRSLIHLQRNASATSIRLSFGLGGMLDCDPSRPSDQDMSSVGKMAAILMKCLLTQASNSAILERAHMSIDRVYLGKNHALISRGLIKFIENILQPERFTRWSKMDLRSDFLLMCSYAHLDGILSFARNTGGMADERVRQEIVSGVRTHLVSVIGPHVYIGPVPSVYHTWCYLISPYPV